MDVQKVKRQRDRETERERGVDIKRDIWREKR